MDRWCWDVTVLSPTSFASSPKRTSDRVRAAPGCVSIFVGIKDIGWPGTAIEPNGIVCIGPLASRWCS